MFKVVNQILSQLAPQYRLPQLALWAAPTVAQHFGDQSIVWPPLGSLDTYAVFGATAIIALCSLLPQLIPTKKLAKRFVLYSLTASVITFSAYAILVARYVIPDETPHNGTLVRSVGFCVEPKIRQLFPDKTDAELLKIGGTEDWQIQKVWTPWSVLAARLSILLTFSFFLGAANIALGSAKRANEKRQV